MSKITLEELDRWIDGLEPKPQTTKYSISDYPFFGLIVRPNGVKSIYIKNGNKKMCDVGFLFKGDGFAKVWNDFVNSKDYIRYEDTIKTLIEKHGLPKSGNLEAACNIKDEEHYSSVFFYFALGRYSKLEDEYKKAREYTTRKIKDIIPNTISYASWLTKYNRNELGLPKEHYYDALSVGNIQDYKFLTDKVLIISAKGRGSRQMCRMDKYGFPRTSPKGSKSVEGFQTGDMVKAIVPKGLKKGIYLGRVVIHSSGYFDIKTKNNSIMGIGHKYCHLIQRGDGYLYSYKESKFGFIAKAE